MADLDNVVLTAAQAHAARLTVCANATDAAEAETLMRMLGLHPSQDGTLTREHYEQPTRFNTKRTAVVRVLRSPHAVQDTLFHKPRALPDPKDG